MPGAIPFLGTCDMNKRIDPLQTVSNPKLIPGSGQLSLSVSRDGPTRVIKVLDKRFVTSSLSEQKLLKFKRVYMSKTKTAFRELGWKGERKCVKV